MPGPGGPRAPSTRPCGLEPVREWPAEPTATQVTQRGRAGKIVGRGRSLDGEVASCTRDRPQTGEGSGGGTRHGDRGATRGRREARHQEVGQGRGGRQRRGDGGWGRPEGVASEGGASGRGGVRGGAVGAGGAHHPGAGGAQEGRTEAAGDRGVRGWTLSPAGRPIPGAAARRASSGWNGV